jgi:hypothetical protein
MIQGNKINAAYEFAVTTPHNILIVKERSPLPPDVTYIDGNYSINKTGAWQITLPMPAGFTLLWYISVYTVPPEVIEANHKDVYIN